MPGKLHDWPAWREFGSKLASEAIDDDFVKAKQDVIREYGEDKLRSSWLAVCKELQKVTEDIASKRNDIVPILDADELLSKGFRESDVATIRQTGCFIVRGVIPEDDARRLYQDLQDYVRDNKAHVRGWPAESPSMLMLYDSPTQNAIRSHPKHMELQQMVNSLWHDETGQTSSQPLIYLDGARDREPGQPFLGLGPHIDAGSLCRWADPKYRRVYDAVFSGRALEHDAWDLGVRKDADQDLFKGPAHSTVLRSFQGWTALTRAAPKEGTLLLYPNLLTTIAYVLLRPFFRPPTDPDSDVMDPETWMFDESGWFPGTFKPESQYMSRTSHPHLRLEDCLVHIPVMEPGDTVWWHCDVCHAVDPVHEGKENAAVVYVGACPSTPINHKYIKSQLEATLAGRPPPDQDDGTGVSEATFKGYRGHEGLNELARRAFGYNL
ncbi:uncharacterized protein B0I36DRAFT_297167 [Microdochium trichocladiopsis]|uniref:DUF1479-domain-containing protein n=1 Tax=Microdochium trichocladiopsis TaxID=1682393 RepID=A0A9P8XYQ9_9PEZI|nr:uncharacterized protein B0I36DRAFT_297167 [Microdochium trichocladiopsis]KAH7021480.1 hypothetical protein B0I36DRAFT_297167 [Microdochium trichocladiopsis]